MLHVTRWWVIHTDGAVAPTERPARARQRAARANARSRARPERERHDSLAQRVQCDRAPRSRRAEGSCTALEQCGRAADVLPARSNTNAKRLAGRACRRKCARRVPFTCAQAPPANEKQRNRGCVDRPNARRCQPSQSAYCQQSPTHLGRYWGVATAYEGIRDRAIRGGVGLVRRGGC